MMKAIAEARNEDVTSLPPVAERLDIDALQVFVESTTVPTTITLEIYECRVEVDGEGNVTVTQVGDVE